MKDGELSKIKRIINLIINLLEKSISNFESGDENCVDENLLNFLIGNKESIVSVINKLSLLLIKINSVDEKEIKSDIELQKDDIKIILDYIKNKQYEIK